MKGARINQAVVVMVIVLGCLGLSVPHGLAKESPRIVEGSKVTLLYHIIVPGEGFEVRDVGSFKDNTSYCRPWSGW
jgi:hypothetical protein